MSLNLKRNLTDTNEIVGLGDNMVVLNHNFECPGNYHGYSNQAFPDITTPGCEVYIVTYYDNYDYVELPGFYGRYGYRPGEIVFMYPKATNV